MVDSERQHLEAERAAQTFNEHRRLLFSIAYRMLGSVSDAEDLLQEAFLRWQFSSARVESPRRFLTTVVSRLCINQLRSARVRHEQYAGQWLPEPIFTPAGSDLSDGLTIGESLSTAFMLLLERLNPVERAVFILREVFDYDYADIAEFVNRSEEHCRQLLHRAHGHVKRERVRFEATAEHHEHLLRRFTQAVLHGDMGGLLSVLSKDVALYADGGGKAAAVPLPVFGADKVARLMIGATNKFAPADLRVRVVPLNGRPAIVAYGGGKARMAITFETAATIERVFIISNPDKLTTIPNLE